MFLELIEFLLQALDLATEVLTLAEKEFLRTKPAMSKPRASPHVNGCERIGQKVSMRPR